MRKEILKQVIHGKPHVHIGKLGITEEVLKQIKIQFKKRTILKIRFLSYNPYDNIQDAGDKIISNVSASIIDTRGKTIIIELLNNLNKNS